MKILWKGDSHLGLHSDGHPRLSEQRRLHQEIVEIVQQINPDVFVDLGDVFDSPRPGPDAYEVAFEYGQALATTGVRSFVLTGNHDKRTRGGVHALSPWKVFGTHLPQVVDSPRVFTFPGEAFELLLLPHVNEWEARAEVDGSAQGWLDACAAAAVGNLVGQDRLIVGAHLELGGATPPGDLVFRPSGLSVPEVLLRSRSVDRVFLGHIHSHQRLEKVTVVGSILYVTFAEVQDQKGLVLYEV